MCHGKGRRAQHRFHKIGQDTAGVRAVLAQEQTRAGKGGELGHGAPARCRKNPRARQYQCAGFGNRCGPQARRINGPDRPQHPPIGKPQFRGSGGGAVRHIGIKTVTGITNGGDPLLLQK